MVDLVLKKNPRHLVADELLRLHLVIFTVQVIVLQTSRDDGELQVATTSRQSVSRPLLRFMPNSPSLEGSIAADLAPHLEGVCVHHIFRARLLVLRLWSI